MSEPLNMTSPVNEAERVLGDGARLRYTVMITYKDGRQWTFQSNTVPVVAYNDSTRSDFLMSKADNYGDQGGVICRWADVEIVTHEQNPEWKAP